ncbi:MAG: PE family protein [Mycobacterium sp.]
MTYLLTRPQAIAVAAADVAGLGAAINDANATAAGAITGVLPAASDEVSAACATLFNSFAAEYQAILKQANAFRDEFAQLLTAAGDAYTQTEAAVSGALADPAPTPVAVSLIMDGSGYPVPPLQYINEVYSLYIAPNFTTSNIQALTTPEQLYPLTGVKSPLLNPSVSQGVTILNDAILQAYQAGTTPINVFGFSQSAVISSLEMPKLVAAGIPSSAVNFVLIGDPMNPNGGVLARFPGLSIPSLGATFFGGTPANDYPTAIYTGEYDGYADFPRYPIDLLADLNALVGIVPVHGGYPTFTPAQVMSATVLPTSGPTMTTYYMIPTPNLPLLDPVRAIPYLGSPLADLLQPDLTYLVNWGYGDPAHGYSTGPANVTTPFGFLPPLSATTALGPDLISGTQQGIAAAAGDFHAQGLPSLPALSLAGISNAFTSGPSTAPGTQAPVMPAPSTIDGIISGLQTANTHLVGDFTNALSTAYSSLLPAADIVNAGVTVVPAYDVNLFLDGIEQALDGDPVAGLVNAIGNPIAADTALVSLGGLLEFFVLFGATYSIAGDFTNL